MTYIKYNETVGSNATNKATTIAGKLETASSAVGSFKGVVASAVSDKKGKLQARIRELNGSINSINGLLSANLSLSEAEKSSYESKRSGYQTTLNKCNGLVEKIDGIESAINGFCDTIESEITEAATYFAKIPPAITAIDAAIKAYNEANSTVEFADENGSLSTITVTNANAGDVQQVTFQVSLPDGSTRDYTIGELLNAYYTYTGMTMSNLVQGQVLADALGIDYTDEMRRGMMASTNSIIDFAAGGNLFGLATQRDLDDTASALGVTDYMSANHLLDALSDEDKEKYGDLLGQMTGSEVSGMSLAAGVLGAYALTGYINSKSGEWTDIEVSNELPTEGTEEQNTTPQEDGPGNYGTTYTGGPTGTTTNGGRNDNSSNKNKKSKTDKDDDDDEKSSSPKTEATTEKPTESPTDSNEPTIPGEAKPTEGTTIPLETPEDASTLPESVEQNVEKDYDALARREYEAQGSEVISQHRAELTEEANRLFDSEDKTELINKLKEYGYSDEDIATIIQDRDLTVNAILSGDQRQQLTQIANRLAAEDKIENFDTKYDDAITTSQLQDGTTSRLLANMSEDKAVEEAYQATETARTDYATAAAEAATALAEVQTAKEALNKVQEGIGTGIKTNPSQWDKETLEKYNTEVKELYNKKVSEVGDKASNWSSEDFETVKNAKTKKEAELSYDKGKDYTTWTSEERTAYEKSKNDVTEAYEKKYGKDHSKWKDEVKTKYQEATDKVYKNQAIEIGKKKLDSTDQETIKNAEAAAQAKIIQEKGNEKNWSEADKKAYEDEIVKLKEKYGAETSLETGKASWTDDQAKEYNDAIKAYNEAIAKAKEAVNKADQAKATYTEKQEAYKQAEEDFYKRIEGENQKTAEESKLITDPTGRGIEEPVIQSPSEVGIGGIEVTEQGARVNFDIKPQNEAPPQEAAQNPGGIIENEVITEEPVYEQNSNYPVIDAGSTSSGTISNEDIKI